MLNVLQHFSANIITVNYARIFIIHQYSTWMLLASAPSLIHAHRRIQATALAINEERIKRLLGKLGNK